MAANCAVTGANRGIGLGVAECCLINGAAKVYSIDLTAPGEEYAEVEKRFPGRLGAVTANVTVEESITAAVDKIVEESGAIHGIVCNAGRTNHKSALDFTKDEIESLFAVNVSSETGSLVLGQKLMGSTVVWCLLYCASRCQSVHQAGH